MLKLPNVTLVCIDNCCHALTELALKESLSKCEFGDTLIFSHHPYDLPVATLPISKDANATDVWRFLWEAVPQMVKTSHFLVQQWDSWVVRPDKWKDEFLKYDYIGAPWNFQDGMDVGNGGFSLRSVELARHIATHPEEYVYGEPEDVQICRIHRPKLQAEGFKWPEKSLAVDFSFEWYWEPRDGHFGFHDPRNFPYILPREEVAKRVKLMHEIPFIERKGILAFTESLMERLGDQCGHLSRA